MPGGSVFSVRAWRAWCCVLAAACFSAPNAHSLQDPDWSQFRGAGGSGWSTETSGFPVDLAAAGTLRWKVAVPEGHSSPVTAGGFVFLTAFEPGQLLTLCLDRENGAELWRRSLAVAEFEKVYQHGPATPTAVSDGKRVFSVFGSFGVVAHDFAGNELWRKPWQAGPNTFGSASSPIVVDGKLVVFSGSETESLLQVLRPENGEVIWERRRPGPASSWSTPSLWKEEGRTAILIYEPFFLRACSLEDGSDLWSVPGLADEPITVPQVGSGLVFATSYNLRTNREASGLPTFGQLLAECDQDQNGSISVEEARKNQSILSRPDADGQGDHPLTLFFRMLDADANGEIVAAEWPRIEKWMEPWTHANGIIAIRPGPDGQGASLAWEHAEGVPECPTPLLAGGLLFAVRNGGVVTCLEAESGNSLFQGRLAGPGPYYASPVGGGGHLYLVSARGVVTVLRAAGQPEVVSAFDLGEPVWATPALSRGCLFLRSAGHLWMFQSPAGPAGTAAGSASRGRSFGTG